MKNEEQIDPDVCDLPDVPCLKMLRKKWLRRFRLLDGMLPFGNLKVKC